MSRHTSKTQTQRPPEEGKKINSEHDYSYSNQHNSASADGLFLSFDHLLLIGQSLPGILDLLLLQVTDFFQELDQVLVGHRYPRLYHHELICSERVRKEYAIGALSEYRHMIFPRQIS
jgi:hypothetical protein